MSFDWSKYERVEEPKKSKEGFDWGKYERVDETPKFTARKAGKQLGRYAKAIGSTIAGQAGDTASLLGSGRKKLAEVLNEEISPERAGKWESLINNPLTTESIKGKIEEFIPSLAPETEEQENEERNLELGAALLGPNIFTRARAFTNPRMQRGAGLAARALGLTEQEAAPLTRGRLGTNFLGKAAGGGRETANQLIGPTEEALSRARTRIGGSVAANTPIRPSTTMRLSAGINRIEADLRHSHVLSPDTESILTMLGRTRESILQGASTPERLMNSFTEINRSINWNAIRNGKRRAAQLKNVFRRAIAEESPQLARQFEHFNQAWGRAQAVRRSLSGSQYKKHLATYTAYHAVHSLMQGEVPDIKKYGLTAGASLLLGRISRRLLTDPHWQTLHNRMLHAARNQSERASRAVLKELSEKVRKEDPEAYEEVDWKALEG